MKRLVCYAHFDGKGQVRPFVLHALQVMKPLCAELIFISNSPLADQDRLLLAKSCSNLIINNNTGYDFYMWKLGLESVDLSLYDEVVLMNSSVFGPLFDMVEAFQQMEQLPCDFWGITECFQMQPHLQTYFLVFKRNVAVSDAFNAFWRGVLPYKNKMQVIQSYEIGLTQWLVESGFQPGVLCPFGMIGEFCATAGKRLRRKDNTSVKFALELLQAGSPFLKRDAVRNHKVAMDKVLPILERADYPQELVDEVQYSGGGDVYCPLCGAQGKSFLRRVRHLKDLQDVGRYDYLRCLSRDCGVIWRKGDVSELRTTVCPSRQTTVAAQDQHAPISGKSAVRRLLVINNSSAVTLGEVCHGDSRLAVAYLDKKGEVIWPFGTIGESPEQEGLFDEIDVPYGLGRIADVNSFLCSCFWLLRPEGTLCVITPNADALAARLFRGCWMHLDVPRSSIHFSRKALEKVTLAAGFKTVSVVTLFVRPMATLSAGIGALLNKWMRPDRVHKGCRSGLSLRYRLALMFDRVGLVHGDVCCLIAKKG